MRTASTLPTPEGADQAYGTYRLRRRRHHARLLRAHRHHPVHRLSPQSCGQRGGYQSHYELHREAPERVAGKYKKFETFDGKFEIDDNFLTEIRTLAEKEKIKFDEKQYSQSLPLIKTQLKALIARDLWDMNEYFRVMNTTNNSVQQALKVLNEDIYSTIIR